MTVRDLLQAEEGPYAVALHIGCGADPAVVWADAARTVIAVEPDPEAAARAKRALSAYGEGSRVIEAAVAKQTGRTTFIRRNLAALSGPREITGAADLFPGLKEVERVSGPCWSPLDLLDEAGVRDVSGRKALLIEAPSESMLILTELKKTGDLARFDTVIAIVPGVELHQDGGDRAALEAWAEQRRMRLVFESDPDDPDLPYARVEVDLMADRAAKSARISELEALLKSAQAEALDHVTARKAAAAENAELQARAERSEHALQAARDDLESLRALVAERDAVLAEQAKQIEGRDGGAGAAQLKEAEARAIAAEAEASTAAEKIQALEERCAEARRKCDSWRKKARRAEAKLEKAAEAKAEAERLQQEARALTDERDELARQLEDQREKLKRTEDQLDDTAAKLLEAAQARDTLRSDLDEAKAKIEQGERDRRALEDKQAASVRDLDEERARARRAEARVDELASKRAEAAAAHEGLEVEMNALRARLEESQAGRSTADERAEEQRQETLRLQSELASARDDLRLALRVQRIAQADLADLQERYDQLMQEKAEVEDLLERVALHLTAQHEGEPEAASPSLEGKEAAKPARKGAAKKKKPRPAKTRKAG